GNFSQIGEHGQRRRKDLLIGNNTCYESPFESLGRGNWMIKGHNFHSPRQTDETRQGKRSTTIDAESTGGVGLSQHHGLSHHAEVAGQSERKASTSGDTVDGRNNRFSHSTDGSDRKMELGCKPA